MYEFDGFLNFYQIYYQQQIYTVHVIKIM